MKPKPQQLTASTGQLLGPLATTHSPWHGTRTVPEIAQVEVARRRASVNDVPSGQFSILGVRGKIPRSHNQSHPNKTAPLAETPSDSPRDVLSASALRTQFGATTTLSRGGVWLGNSPQGFFTGKSHGTRRFRKPPLGGNSPSYKGWCGDAASTSGVQSAGSAGGIVASFNGTNSASSMEPVCRRGGDLFPWD